MRVLLTVLTCRRPKYLARTLDAARRYVFDPAFCKGRIFVNAEDPRTVRVSERHRDMFERVETRTENLSQGPALTDLWTDPGADYILHLEDDMVAVRGGWLSPCLEFLDANADVGQLRLYHAHHTSDVNPLTGRPIELEPGASCAHGAVHRTREPAHLTYCPSLMRSDAVCPLLPIENREDQTGGRTDSERAAQEAFHSAGWATAQFLPGLFKHIGTRSAFGGWGVGLGFHPSSRLGKARRRVQRFLVGVAKRVLGRS